MIRNTFYILILFKQNVRHLTTASGAKYAVSTKAKAHQTDNEKGKTPQGVRNCFMYTYMLYMCTPALYIICTINLHLHVRIIYLLLRLYSTSAEGL